MWRKCVEKLHLFIKILLNGNLGQFFVVLGTPFLHAKNEIREPRKKLVRTKLIRKIKIWLGGGELN